MCTSLGLKNFELSLETAENYVSLKFSMFTKANYPSKCMCDHFFIFSYGPVMKNLKMSLLLRKQRGSAIIRRFVISLMFEVIVVKYCLSKDCVT